MPLTQAPYVIKAVRQAPDEDVKLVPKKMTSTSLGEGPIYLARGKEEEIKSSGLGMRGMYQWACSIKFIK